MFDDERGRRAKRVTYTHGVRSIRRRNRPTCCRHSSNHTTEVCFGFSALAPFKLDMCFELYDHDESLFSYFDRSPSEENEQISLKQLSAKVLVAGK